MMNGRELVNQNVVHIRRNASEELLRPLPQVRASRHMSLSLIYELQGQREDPR